MHRTLQSLLLFSAIIIGLALVLPKPVNASPGLTTSFTSRPGNWTVTGYDTGDISDPTYAYDGDTNTCADWQVAVNAPSNGAFEVNTFSTTGAPTTESIVFVDFTMKYEFDGGSDDEYRILYYVSPSSTPVVLQGWSAATFSASTVTWLSQSEPNDGAWSWTDIQSIRFVVEGGPGAGGKTQREVFEEYEAWVSVYSARISDVWVNPASTTNPSSPFSVSVDISSVDDLYGWEFKLFYEKSILNGNSVTEGAFLSSGGTTFFTAISFTDNYNATHGIVWYTCTLTGNVAGVTGSGTLASISFNVAGGASGTTSLHLERTRLTGIDQANTRVGFMGHTTTDGSVTISAVPEFPFGAALEIGLITVVAYVWWRSKRKQPLKSFSKVDL